MTLLEFIEKYNSNKKWNIKDMTASFNKLDVDERRIFLSELEDKDRGKFISDIR